MDNNSTTNESMKDYEDKLDRDNFEARAWEHLESLKKKNEVLNVTVDGFTTAGLICFIEDIRGLIPKAQIGFAKENALEKYLGTRMDVKIIRINPEKRDLILSAKAVLKDKEKQAKIDAIKKFAIGSKVQGKVESLTDFGAFVKISDEVSGLVHVSQISDKRIATPKGVLAVGQDVEAKVIGNTNGKLSLSIKALNDDKGVIEDFSELDMPEVKDATTSMAALFKDSKLD